MRQSRKLEYNKTLSKHESKKKIFLAVTLQVFLCGFVWSLGSDYGYKHEGDIQIARQKDRRTDGQTDMHRHTDTQISVLQNDSGPTSQIKWLTTAESVKWYRPLKHIVHFGQAHDFIMHGTLFKALHEENLCGKEMVIVAGGFHKGEFETRALKYCPNVSIHTVEVNPQSYRQGVKTLEPFPNAKLYNAGWSKVNTQVIVPNNIDGMFWLRKDNISGSKPSKPTDIGDKVAVNVMDMPTFLSTFNITRPHFALIDVEGQDTQLIESMELGLEANQEKFPIFQIELSTPDPESQKDAVNNGEWGQAELALHLDACGYDLFMIGWEYFWKVEPLFFVRGYGAHLIFKGMEFANVVNDAGEKRIRETTNKMFVWGNLLVVHRTSCEKDKQTSFIKKFVFRLATQHAEKVRSGGDFGAVPHMNSIS
jgi:FkbM family methyltransferase